MRIKSKLACFAMALALGWAPMAMAVTASVSGCVRDSAGVPQMGARIQLLRFDTSVAATTETDIEGRYRIASIIPGRYSIKVIAESFLPSLRENVRVRAGTVVNLTLNTLLEAMQWLPAKADSQNSHSDDWAWTLRAAANRPLLRWLEDGPLVVVSDGPGAQPKLKARLMATGQAGTFGESGERFSAAVEDTPNDSGELLARVDFDPGTDAGMESMLGFRQDLGLAGSVQSVAAVAIHPEVASGPDRGLEEATVRNSETMRLGEALEAEAGSTLMVARLHGAGAESLNSALPFAGAKWRRNTYTVGYRLATAMPDQEASGAADNRWLPRLAEGNGRLQVEHGLHQEIAWERHTDNSGVSIVLYQDRIENPVIEAAGRTSDGTAGAALFDPRSGLMRAAGPGYGARGVAASMERSLPGGNRMRLSYASGSALAMPPAPAGEQLRTLIAAARPRSAQAYSITVSGTLEGTDTRWQASYSWQPEDTVTEVAPFTAGPPPHLHMRLRQPVLAGRDGSLSIDALLNVENLLAEGYHPFVMPDGSLAVFSQGQRSFSTGLAITF